jgi:glycosyltransferase involved in cell wall biosynthesis
LRLGVKRRVERAVYRRAREIIVLSAAFRRILVEQYGIQPWIVTPVPPAVDLGVFTPGDRGESRRRLDVSDDIWLAVAARRLVPRMGVDVLVDAWADVTASASRPVLLAIVGDGPDRTALEAQAQARGLGNAIRFVGAQPETGLVDWYRAANVSVVPTLALEGFGIVVLESLACGTPPIVTNVGGLPETVARLDRNLIVPARDPKALGERLEDALEDAGSVPPPDVCRRYSETFTWESVVKATREVYQRAIDPHRRRRVRVVYLDHCADLSGGEIALLRLLSVLDEVDAHVILAQEGPFVSRLLQAGISVEVLPLPERTRGLRRERVRAGGFGALQLFDTAKYTLRLARRLRTLKPDLVHTNSLKSGLYGCAAARLARIPSIWHLRDRIAADYLPEGAVRLVRMYAPRMATMLIANSQTTLATVKMSVPQAAVIPTPVIHDPVVRNESTPRVAGDLLHVGMVGRLAPWKGQHIFLEAFARAFPAGPQQASVIGGALFGEDEYEHSLRELAERLGLDGRVVFTGFRENVIEELLDLDILVHASVIPEPFGQVVVEGMAAGVPVVASRAGGPTEVLEDGVTGLMFTPGDADDLARCLRRLAGDPALRRRLAEAGRERAADFGPEAIAPQVMDVYDYVLAQR